MFLAKYLRAFDWDIEKSLEVMLQIYKMRVRTAAAAAQLNGRYPGSHFATAHTRETIPPGSR